MTLPTSIPSWQKIVKSLAEKNVELKLNVDPFNGKHGGTLFYKDKTIPFKIEVFPKNMVLSLKEYNEYIFNSFAYAFEFSPAIIYKVNDNNSTFVIHAEWYFRCEESEIVQEVNKLKNATNVEIFK